MSIIVKELEEKKKVNNNKVNFQREKNDNDINSVISLGKNRINSNNSQKKNERNNPKINFKLSFFIFFIGNYFSSL